MYPSSDGTREREGNLKMLVCSIAISLRMLSLLARDIMGLGALLEKLWSVAAENLLDVSCYRQSS